MIFLDIDDTLVTHTEALNSAATEFGIRFRGRLPYYDDFLSAWMQTLQLHMKSVREGKISLQEHQRRRIRDIFQASLTDRFADKLFSYYLKLYENGWKLFDDVLPFLDSHPGEKFGIISGWDTKPQVRKLEKTGILNYFSCIVTEEMANAAKPSKKLFEYALKVSGCRAENAIYIGDNLQKDAKASCEARFRGIWLNRNHLECQENVESIPRLTELRL
jgi:putative hydrolase of the HAD superfamily